MDSPESLARAIQDFLTDAATAVVLENGEPLFDLAHTRYSLSTEYGKCVLHLWSAERNTVRRVVGVEQKDGTLYVKVLRFGQAQPGKLEICRDRDRRTPSQRKAARTAYQARLKATLERSFPGSRCERFTSGMDLEHSFSPVYTRGLLVRGGAGFAVMGVNAQEPQAAIDGALTFALLWLDYCRHQVAPRARLQLVEGLKLFVPAGTGAIVRERMAHLNRAAAHWQLYEFDERDGVFLELDTADRGNIATRLIHCVDRAAVQERFAASIQRVLSVVPEAAVTPVSATEVSFRLHGLEVARARMEPEPESFHLAENLIFGAGANETRLTEETAAFFAELGRQASAIRRPDGPRAHSLWRMAPERWLESVVVRNASLLDDRLDPECVYSQVPAFAAADRAMIDVLGITRQGQLAVLELKADEDIHLPLQGIDYWARVEWHRQRGEFGRYGYFPGHPPTEKSALLLLVAPALHVHPATDTILRYLAPEIDCTLLGIDEHWRDEIRVLFRKKL